MKKIVTIIVVVLALQLGVASVASADSGNYHKVRYGETLYSIGRHYGVSPYKIADANGLYNPNHIYAGQVLYIPSGRGDCYNDCGNSGGKYHTVRYGETLYSIGRHYGVHPNRIARANNLYNPNYIYAGQVLHIPSGRGHGYDYGKGHDYGRDRGCGDWNNCNSRCGDWNNCGNSGWSDCNSGCNNSNYYGYDYTGYYYVRGDQRYSHTCGYYYNCW